MGRLGQERNRTWTSDQTLSVEELSSFESSVIEESFETESFPETDELSELLADFRAEGHSNSSKRAKSRKTAFFLF